MSMIICNAKLIDSGVPSVTGRTYPVDVLTKIAKKDVIYGELGPVAHMDTTVQADRCSHKIVNMNVRHGVLYGDVQVLQNPMGELFNMFGQYKTTNIEFRPRGVGMVNEKTKNVSDYNIIALDCYMSEAENDNT